jgi:hypothetical protein
MKLVVWQPKVQHHTQLVAALAWSGDNDVYSCGDDQTIQRWGSGGEAGFKVGSTGGFRRQRMG